VGGLFDVMMWRHIDCCCLYQDEVSYGWCRLYLGLGGKNESVNSETLIYCRWDNILPTDYYLLLMTFTLAGLTNNTQVVKHHLEVPALLRYLGTALIFSIDFYEFKYVQHGKNKGEEDLLVVVFYFI